MVEGLEGVLGWVGVCGWEGSGAVRLGSLRKRVAGGRPLEIKGAKQEQKAVKQIQTADQALDLGRGKWCVN